MRRGTHYIQSSPGNQQFSSGRFTFFAGYDGPFLCVFPVFFMYDMSLEAPIRPDYLLTAAVSGIVPMNPVLMFLFPL